MKSVTNGCVLMLALAAGAAHAQPAQAPMSLPLEAAGQALWLLPEGGATISVF